MPTPWTLSPDRCFSAEPSQRAVARGLYAQVRGLPILSPHGHVEPALLSDPQARLGSPAGLFIIPDHYIFRMLYSQGVSLESLGIPVRPGAAGGAIESDPRRIWQIFAESFHLFRGTPTGLWLADELINVFGVTEKLTGESAQRIYDHLAERLASEACRPRTLFDQFNIETLCTTDAATTSLDEHRAIRDGAWRGNVRPTFRPDAVVNIASPDWLGHIAALSERSGVDVRDYASYIDALRQRRAVFKELGAVATDHAARSPRTARLSEGEIHSLFDFALQGSATEDDADRFTAHMLMEFAQMSTDDGLVMQLHVGSARNHNPAVFDRFGADKGADMPLATEWTRNLQPLLAAYGNDARFRLILFTLDESTYGRELAPLAGHYPSVLLGPPWWFFDSVNGMRRFLDRVVETAGLANLAGFNDDTRAFCSIPARHDVWRRVTCDWLAGLVVQGLVDEDDAQAMAHDCAYGLAKRAYRLP